MLLARQTRLLAPTWSRLTVPRGAALAPGLTRALSTTTCLTRALSTTAPPTTPPTESHSSMTAAAWLALAEKGSTPPLRFPLGTPVKCFVGPDVPWVHGTVVAHNYREPNWPAAQLSAPYQVLLADAKPTDQQNAIWAPADVDEIIRAGFRFELGDRAECRISEDEWVKCTVVGLLYREQKWPEGQYAPYQVRIDGVLPGSVDERAAELAAKGQLIWLPQDTEESIKPVSAEREARLEALASLRASGALSDDEFKERRREIVHAA